MMRHTTLSLLSAALLFFCGCGPRPTAALEEFDKEIYTPLYASGFEIVGREGSESTILRTKSPWQGAAGHSTELFIARNGETAPAGFTGEILADEARRIVCMSSSYVAMLDAVGAVERVVGVSGVGNICNRYVTANRDRIGEVGFDGNIDYERLVALSPDLVLLFGVNGASGMETKLRELGIPFAYMGEYLEESPLGKAEWMVAVAEVAGRRSEGERCFSGLPERYEALRAKAAAATASAPKVMLNTPYGGSWFMASASSYVARLIADAGGDYIYRKNTSNRSLPIDLEEAYLLAAQADIWLNVGSIATLEELKARYPKFAGVRCVAQGEVYNCDKRLNSEGGNDYWESGVVRPDAVLHDLIAILHPELLDEEERTLSYYRKLE